MAIGISGCIEPLDRHPFPVVWIRQQRIDVSLVGVGRRVGQERVDGGRRGRQPGEVEGEPTGERDAICFRIRREPLLLQPPFSSL